MLKGRTEKARSYYKKSTIALQLRYPTKEKYRKRPRCRFYQALNNSLLYSALVLLFHKVQENGVSSRFHGRKCEQLYHIRNPLSSFRLLIMSS